MDACTHANSHPVAIENDGTILWECDDCPDRWNDNTTPAEAVRYGWITSEEAGALE